MPFTPFHLGPALAIGLPLRNQFHAPTFTVANIILDIEPFLVMYFNIYYYPLHGYAHTFLGALIIGFLTSLAMYASRKIFRGFFKTLKLITREQKLSSYILAGLSGTSLHVLLDSPLYDDIKPLYPLDINPFFNPSLTLFIYDLCIYLFLLGLFMYLAVLIRSK